MADIIYTLQGGTYFNITNQCPCNCAFCIRSKKDAVGDASRLWYDDAEPSVDEIKTAIDEYDFSSVDEAVFCGYGEPTCRLDVLLEIASYLKQIKSSIHLRLNTNGLSDLINGRSTGKEIGEAFDSVSVSLNEPDSEQYDKITRNIYPGKAYPALLEFTRECAKYCKDVRMSVVDVIGEENINKSREIAESLGARFVCRSFEKER
jgi:radical SAM enzyme (TIGR04100 family)